MNEKINYLNLTISDDNASQFSVKMFFFYCRAMKEALTNHMEEPVPQHLLVPIVTVTFDSSIHFHHMLFLTGNPELDHTMRIKINGLSQFPKLLCRKTVRLLASFLNEIKFLTNTIEKSAQDRKGGKRKLSEVM